MKWVKGKGGVLEFGTEVVAAKDGSIAGLLGASPGASTAVAAMTGLLERCFPERYAEWKPQLTSMMPSLDGGADYTAAEFSSPDRVPAGA
jgi:malate dehydrogenase (quinone)